jgi:hypothetical protein
MTYLHAAGQRQGREDTQIAGQPPQSRRWLAVAGHVCPPASRDAGHQLAVYQISFDEHSLDEVRPDPLAGRRT